jgi:hypothetical protein
MKKITYFIFLFIITAMLILTSCKQNSTNPAEENIQSSEDNALVDSEFSTIYSYVDSQHEAIISGAFHKTDGNGIQEVTVERSALLPECAVVTWDSLIKKLTIDFGTTNCKCADDLWRKGKIFIQFKGKYPEVNSGWTTTLENYYVQDMSVSGTKTITFLALFKVNIEVKNASLVTPTGTIKWNANRTIEKLWGQLTPKNTWDDVYSITGSADGVNRQGTAFTVTIDQPLKKAVICQKKDFLSGIITIINDKGNTLSVDYNANGDEACNKLAKVTVNGQSKIIVLR